MFTIKASFGEFVFTKVTPIMAWSTSAEGGPMVVSPIQMARRLPEGDGDDFTTWARDDDPEDLTLTAPTGRPWTLIGCRAIDYAFAPGTDGTVWEIITVAMVDFTPRAEAFGPARAQS